MSRLDRHVALVQNKLAMRTFVQTLAWTVFIAGIAVVLGVILWRVMGNKNLPAMKWWVMIGGVMTAGAALSAWLRRPAAYEAAVAIDEKLQLKEKFSTALAVRPSKDLFAQATVRDAEATADNIQLQRQFPVTFPRVGYGALAMIALACTLGLWMKPMDLFGYQAVKKEQSKQVDQQINDAKRKIEQAMVAFETLPRNMAEDPKLKAEAKALGDILKNQKFDDPNRMARKASEVLQDVQQALADEAEKTRTKAMEQEKTFAESFGDASDYKSEDVKKVDNDLAKNKFDNAVTDLEKMTKKFDKMTEEEKDKAAEDMKKLAQKLEKAGENPKVQKDIEDKLQQMGMSQQQAAQMAQQMQQAAQGDQKAQQQLANQVQQMQQQMQQQAQQLQQQAQAGNQQAQQQLAQLKQQQQQVQQAVQGMQGKANAQAQAQQMAQAAQQMAQAMQQQAQAAQQGQKPQPGQQGQAAQQGQKSQQGQQGQKGQQGQQGTQAGQQMAQAQAQMQQAMQAMQAAQTDAQQVAAAQQQAMKQGGQQGQQGQGQGQGQHAQPVPGNQGQWQEGDPNQKQGGNGMNDAAMGNGGQTRNKATAGFDVKSEHDIGEENKAGKVLASTMIKDNQPIKGQAKLGLAQVTESVQKQASDEVDEDHVSGQSRQAAEEYFRTMNRDASKK